MLTKTVVRFFYGMVLTGFLFACSESQEKQTNNTNRAYEEAANDLRAAIQVHFYDSITGYYKEYAEKERNERPASFLWPLCALIQADETEEIRGGQKGLVDATLGIVQQYYDARPPAPGYASYPPALGGGDRFYDDNQWIGIALMDAWKNNGHPDYLKTSRLIYDFMMTAYDTVGGGGLYWEEGKPTKNTCSNGPGIILALQLYNATGEKGFLDTAVQLYSWVNRNLRSPEGLYWDNVQYPSLKVDSVMYSYNTGTMLQSALYLFEITKDSAYLRDALQSANASKSYFYSAKQLKDDIWFNAVLLRAYQHLLKHDNNREYVDAFKNCIDTHIATTREKNGLFLKKQKTVNLVNQAGMLEILNRLIIIE